MKSPARTPGILDAELRHPHLSPSSRRMQGSDVATTAAVKRRSYIAERYRNRGPRTAERLREGALASTATKLPERCAHSRSSGLEAGITDHVWDLAELLA